MPPIEHISSIHDIDFAAWHRDHGIDVVLFDVEGTLTEWSSRQIPDATIRCLEQARVDGIRHIGLVTNISPRKAKRVASLARQISADTYRYPTSLGVRKPSGAMIRDSLGELGVTPEHCAFVGDKIVDCLAGRNAHVARIAWVQRHGTADHWFDRLIYRPIERLVRKALH